MCSAGQREWKLHVADLSLLANQSMSFSLKEIDMKLMKPLFLALVSTAAMTVRAGELSPEMEAKFLKVIVSSSGNTKISCNDSALKAALEAQGVTVDSSASIAWVSNPVEAKMAKSSGRLVITSKKELAASVSVVLEEEGGRPKILLNPTNLHASRVQLGDAVLKIAEKI